MLEAHSLHVIDVHAILPVLNMVACDCRAICKAAGHDDVLNQLANGLGYQDEDESDTMRFSRIVSSYFYYCQHGMRFRERSVDRQRHVKDLQHILREVVQGVTRQVYWCHVFMIGTTSSMSKHFM